jgi:hypothetical protein
MVTLLFFRKAQRQIDIAIDESQLTPADYTICVKNIPIGLDIDYKVTLTNIFSHYAVPGRELEITKIVLVYDIDEIIELEEELKDEVIVKKQAILRENKYIHPAILDLTSPTTASRRSTTKSQSSNEKSKRSSKNYLNSPINSQA